MTIADLPALNATLNATSAILLTIGWVLIRRGRWRQHRAIARWTLPLWIYVSITGVVVYVMLYRL